MAAPPAFQSEGCRSHESFSGSTDIPVVMAAGRFKLAARISSDAPDAVKPVLEQLLPKGSFRTEGGEFVVSVELEGSDPKEMNRNLLSAIRRAEKKTRMRSEWTSEDGFTYRFFDYVLKKRSKTKGAE